MQQRNHRSKEGRAEGAYLGEEHRERRGARDDDGNVHFGNPEESKSQLARQSHRR